METGSAVAAATGDAAESAHAYRPHLDGLRAVAVYLVVVFHAGSDRFAGGYIGVDVFFVLSGFLVTQLLLRDITGSVRSVSVASIRAGSAVCFRRRSSR
jgi:peptidoglycan/LPS O-acetylase OafA/YrhL